jgi:hypothetical protein
VRKLHSWLVFLFGFAVCGIAHSQSVPVVESSAKSQVLSSMGEKLGIDFSNPLFADQTICYDEFEKFYGNQRIGFSLICAKNKAQHVNIFWIRNYLPEELFARRTAEYVGTLRSVPVSEVVVTPQKRDQNKHYHLVKIGSVMSHYQGYFFHRTEKSDRIGLETVILVKAATLESTEKLLLELEQALKGAQNTASLAN